MVQTQQALAHTTVRYHTVLYDAHKEEDRILTI